MRLTCFVGEDIEVHSGLAGLAFVGAIPACGVSGPENFFVRGAENAQQTFLNRIARCPEEIVKAVPVGSESAGEPGSVCTSISYADRIGIPAIIAVCEVEHKLTGTAAHIFRRGVKCRLNSKLNKILKSRTNGASDEDRSSKQHQL
jgi:hypothetical protein